MTDQYRDPERLDLASASSFETDVMCPGRRNLLATLPPEAFKPATDEEADRGTLFHEAWEKDDPSKLEDEEDLQTYNSGNKTGEEIVATWARDFGITEFKEGPRELRLWIHDPETLRPLASAKLDKHFVAEGRVCIDERKSLWCSNLTPAERNYQGRLQAVLIAKEYGASHVRVAFNKAMFGKSDVVDYNESDLQHAERSVYFHLWETRQPEAQRRAGPHCRYCPAQTYCREAASFAMLPSVNNLGSGPVSVDATSEAIDTMVSLIAPRDLALLHTRSGIVTKILDAVKARLKSMTDEELNVIGLARGKGRQLDSFIRVKECFESLKTFGISENEIWSALDFKKGELIKVLQRDQGWPKAKAEGWVKQLVGEYGETKTSDALLVQI